MDALITFIYSFAAYLAFDTLYVFSQTGWTALKFEKYWQYSEGKGAIIEGYAKLFFGVLIIVVLSMTVNGAFAGEWVNGGSVSVGLECSNEQSVFCQSKGINNKCNSNLRVEQNIYDHGNGVTWNGTGTHHSCFANPDSVGYDKAGISITIKY